MRELHVVALSSDGKHLIVTPTKGSLKGAYLLPVNARLRKALNGELNPKPAKARATAAAEARADAQAAADEVARKQAPKPPAESRLSPREIQARLRAGHTPERVARAAGVPLDRVTRFQGPVLSERALVLDAARDATLNRSRRGDSAAPLGASVTANLSAKGVTAGPDDWTAFRRADGAWVVALTVAAARGKARRAEWCWVPATKALTALDAYAAQLGYVDRPVKPPRKAAAKKPAATKPAAKPAATKPATRAAGRTR